MKNTVVTIQKAKKRGEKIPMRTAYDYSMAKLIDESGINMILVGDSLGMVMLGYEDTLSVTMEDMIHHTKAVTRGAKNALIVADMPFMSYQTSVYDAVVNAGRLSHEIIGDLNGGMCAFYDWNLLLDETGGPNHVGNLCHAPFLYDRQHKELLPQLIQKYFYHFAHFVEPGAKRIAFSKYTDELDVTAVQKPDGKIVIVILNRSEECLSVVLRLQEHIVPLQVEAQSICTGVIV